MSNLERRCLDEGLFLESSNECKNCADAEECKQKAQINKEGVTELENAVNPKISEAASKKTKIKTKETKETLKKEEKEKPKKEQISDGRKSRSHGIQELAESLLLDPENLNKTHEEIAEMVRKEKGTKTSAASIAWYRQNMKKNGIILPKRTPKIKAPVLAPEKPKKSEKSKKDEKVEELEEIEEDIEEDEEIEEDDETVEETEETK